MDFEVRIKSEYIVHTVNISPLKSDSENGNARKSSKLKFKPKRGKLCVNQIKHNECHRKNCTQSHDVSGYWESVKSIDSLMDKCPVFEEKGFCKFGVTCRANPFQHVDEKGRNSQGNPVMEQFSHHTDSKLFTSEHLYLAPLTTLGNLPFRRICKEFGADITCGEMALVSQILSGNNSELALLRSHPIEDKFGVQITGTNAKAMAKCAKKISDEFPNVKFIDVNAACPLDIIANKGMGASLMSRKEVLCDMIKGMKEVTNLPISVKLRTGFQYKQNINEIIPNLVEAGCSAIVLHGRTRYQRYSGLADWNYIELCASSNTTVPIYGAGDVFNYMDLQKIKDEYPNISGVALGRGALIKPWIFTELKENRLWDITSSERLDIIKKYVYYGLSHWGSDLRGVETTRRFLLEWLSFLHRYVPVGILEVVPQQMNYRVGAYRGRNEMETLLSSSSSADWIKVSEIFLGKVPDGFFFEPKHKASAIAPMDA